MYLFYTKLKLTHCVRKTDTLCLKIATV